MVVLPEGTRPAMYSTYSATGRRVRATTATVQVQWTLHNLNTCSLVFIGFYVYWTVHHLDNWIKRDHLDVTCFFISLFNAQHVSDVNTSILRSLRLICWVISWVVLLWFDVCWCYVVVWLGWGPAYGYHTTPAKPQRNTNRAIQPTK